MLFTVHTLHRNGLCLPNLGVILSAAKDLLHKSSVDSIRSFAYAQDDKGDAEGVNSNDS